MRARQQELDIHASLYGFHQEVDLIVGGCAIRICDPDSLFRGRERGCLQQWNRSARKGTRFDNLCFQIADGRESRELATASERLAKCLDPMSLKGGLQLGDHRSFHPGVCVAPMV